MEGKKVCYLHNSVDEIFEDRFIRVFSRIGVIIAILFTAGIIGYFFYVMIKTPPLPLKIDINRSVTLKQNNF